MNAKEALKLLEDKSSIDGLFRCLSPAMETAIAALREKAEREEKERKPTLKEQVEACYYASGLACGPHVQFLEVAGDTLRRLDEEGGEILKREEALVPCGCGSSRLLSSLGVEARKP